MVDEEKDQTEPLPPERLIEFFKTKNINGLCPICSTNKWGVVAGQEKGITPFIPAKRLLNGWDVYALACMNCGFIRQHLKILVDGTWTPEQDPAS